MSRPHIAITYCTQCNWLLRASWMASELLNTFGTELGSLTLVPGDTVFIAADQVYRFRSGPAGFAFA